MGAIDFNETQKASCTEILQWNAESVYNEGTALADRRHKENIDVARLQDTRLREPALHHERLSGVPA